MRDNKSKDLAQDRQEQAAGRGAQSSESPSQGEAHPKVRSKSLQKHIVICPHCGAEALDHMTKCPECKGDLRPKGYRPIDRDSLRKFKRAAWIVSLVLAAVIVVLIFVRGS